MLLLILIVACTKPTVEEAVIDATPEEYSVLPETFTMKYCADATSSGATRLSWVKLGFVGDTLVVAKQNYSVDDVAGNDFTCYEEASSGTWELVTVDERAGTGNCKSSAVAPPTREQLEEGIMIGRFVSCKEGENPCYNLIGGKLCYSLEK